MTIQQQIRAYLDTSNISMQALSLQAGLKPKVVHDILNLTGIRPDRRKLDALGEVMGLYLPTPRQVTYARLIKDLSISTGNEKIDNRNRVLVSRLTKFINTAGWVAETEMVDRRRAIEEFSNWSAATLSISPESVRSFV